MTYPRIVRSCECHNRHVWQGVVKFGKGTPNMLGIEEEKHCPFCSSRATAESCWRVQISPWTVFEFDRVLGTDLGANPPPFGVEKSGCGKLIHIPGTNSGTMPCGGKLTRLDGTEVVELCHDCEKGTHA